MNAATAHPLAFATVRHLLNEFPNPYAATAAQISTAFDISLDAARVLRRLGIEHVARADDGPAKPRKEPTGVSQVMDQCGVNGNEARAWLRLQGRGYA